VMRRRSRASSKLATTRSRKAKTLKAVRQRSSSPAGQETEVARLRRERDEALEREKASAEVLRIISTSPGELKPIFQAMLENAVRVCEAVFGNLYLRDADGFRMVAAHHDSPAYVAARMSDPLWRPPPDAPLGRLAITKEVVQVADIRTLSSRDHPFVAPGVKAGNRTVLAIPLLKHDELVGAFTLIRQKVQTFTEKQIALLQNFAAQAVIAIENARLLNELRQSLEQQTATSEVLRVISSSPNELGPVFETMLANATHLCEANFGALNLYDNGAFPVAAMHNVPNAYAEYRRHHPISISNIDRRHPLARVAATKQVLQIDDMRKEALYIAKDPSFVAIVDLAGTRTLFVVPMLKENDLLGSITIFRQEVRPFTDKQIELVQNFAAP
jgi:GAF domain-containing protein